MNKMIIGIDVSKNDLDVAFWQNDKSFFLGKYPNNQNGTESLGISTEPASMPPSESKEHTR